MVEIIQKFPKKGDSEMWYRESRGDERTEYVSDERMEEILANPANGWRYERLSDDRILAITPLVHTERIYVHVKD